MLDQFKIYIYGAIAAVIISVVLGGLWYYNWSQAEIKVLRDNNAKLELAVETQKETIRVIKRDAKLAGKLQKEVNTEFAASRKAVDKLRRKMARHDIAYLAYSKPNLVEKIVTNASNDAERCFEILSGSPLTDDEKAATKKSKANSECPGIANPNYTPRKRR